MALESPSIADIADSIIADIESKTNQTIPLLSKAVFRILAYALAGVFIILYKYGAWQFSQIFPQLADEEFLELLGENKRVSRTPAITFEGELDITVLADGDILAGTQFINNQSGVIYLVTTGVSATVPLVTVDIKATTPGEIGNLLVSQEIAFVNPQTNFARTAILSAITIDGVDEEDLELYRQRVIDAYQKQPQGGALADYEQWAEETPNVINAYPYPGTLPSEVNVYIEVDNQIDGIPTAPQLAAALNYITYDPITGRQDRKPVTADVTTYAIIRAAFDVEITGLSPDTPEIRTAIQNAVISYFLDKEPYILGLAIIRKDKITLAGCYATAENIAAINGATFTTLDLEKGGSPITSYTLADGEKAKLNGNITWS